MGYKIRYNDDDPATQRQACLDAAQYAGFSTMRKLVQIINEPAMSFGAFGLCAAFAGVRGYPIRAMWSRYRKDQTHDKEDA